MFYLCVCLGGCGVVCMCFCKSPLIQQFRSYKFFSRQTYFSGRILPFYTCPVIRVHSAIFCPEIFPYLGVPLMQMEFIMQLHVCH